MKKTLTVLMMVLLAAMLFISCDNSTSEPKKEDSSTTPTETPTEKPTETPTSFTVTFNLNGGSGDISSQTVVKDGKATRPATDPTPSNTNYYMFEFWTKEGETTEFDFANTAITADTTLVAKWKNKYKVGDTGPAGGKIFYVVPDSEGTKTSVWGSDSLTWKYLEAATSNASVGSNSGYYIWSPSGATGSTGTGIGSGWSNNLTLSGDNFSAAKACRDYSNNGISDWFLPSKDELLELYRQKEQIGGTFATDLAYWTSSMADNGNAYTVDFSSGTPSDSNPLSYYELVRPIRAF